MSTPNLVTAQSNFIKHTYDSVVYAFAFSDVLPEGVTITSVDHVVITTFSGSSSANLTSTGAQPNSVALTNPDVAIGKAVVSTIAAGTTGCVYQLVVEVTCSDSEQFGGIFRVTVY